MTLGARKPDPVRFYVASRIENAPEVTRLVRALEAWGWECTYAGSLVGNVRGTDDAAPERVRATCRAECRAVVTADVVIFLLPGGRGTHTALGLALAAARRPRIVLACEDADLFGYTEKTTPFYHAKRCEHIVGGVDRVIAHLDGDDTLDIPLPDAEPGA